MAVSLGTAIFLYLFVQNSYSGDDQGNRKVNYLGNTRWLLDFLDAPLKKYGSLGCHGGQPLHKNDT